MTPETYEFSFYESGRPTLLARVTNADGTLITQAVISSIAVSIRSYDDPTEELSSDVPVVAATVFDTLQNDDVWNEDEEGYNFRYIIPAGKMTKDDQYSYLIEVVFTSTTDTIPVLWKANQLEVASTA